jgi:hypothetical protein
MALGSTQPLTEMSTSNFLGEVKGGLSARKADNLTAISEPIVLENVGASRACYRDSFFSFPVDRRRHI